MLLTATKDPQHLSVRPSTMPLTTPKNLSADVLKFCNSLGSVHSPTFVKVLPNPNAQVNECFFNVKSAVHEIGGKQIFGWCIWIWEGVYIEAEHHSVWYDGINLIDVTPKPQNEDNVLFVQDDLAVFDFNGVKRKNNLRRSLTNDPKVAEYLSLHDQAYSLMEKYSTGRQASIPADLVRPLAYRTEALLLHIRGKYLGPNNLCTCGSGVKVKKCCGIEKAKTLNS